MNQEHFSSSQIIRALGNNIDNVSLKNIFYHNGYYLDKSHLEILLHNGMIPIEVLYKLYINKTKNEVEEMFKVEETEIPLGVNIYHWWSPFLPSYIDLDPELIYIRSDDGALYSYFTEAI